jgi:simple sugar transport system substrate-binding protein
MAHGTINAMQMTHEKSGTPAEPQKRDDMKNVRTLITLTVMALTGLFLVGCGSQPDQGRQPATGIAADSITVGFAQTGAESAWRTAETVSIKAEAEKRGITLKFADGQGKQENQIKAIRAFIAQGVDAILLAPLVDSGWEPVLKEAKKAEIPVILVSRGVEVSDDSLYVTKIASDFVNEGRAAGKWVVDKTGGTANVVELVGTPGSDCAKDRKNGFQEAIEAAPGVKIIASQSGDFRRTGGKEVMEALLKKHGKDINVVYAHNDDMALGAIQAIEEAGLKPGVDIHLVSIDGVKAAFEAMAKETLSCSIECPPLHGPAAFDAVADTLAGKTLPKHTVIDLKVFEPTQARELIDSRPY